MIVINNSEFLFSEEVISTLPKIPTDEIKNLHATDSFDGPIAGTCTYKEKTYFFFVDDASTVKDSTTYFDPCRYILISLTPEQETERLSYAMVDNPYKNDVGSGYHANYIIRVRIDIKREQLIGWFLL